MLNLLTTMNNSHAVLALSSFKYMQFEICLVSDKNSLKILFLMSKFVKNELSLSSSFKCLTKTI